MIHTVNKKLAVAPFAIREVKTKRVSGVALMEHLVQLEKTTVLFPNQLGVPPGTVIYVAGENVKHKWASEVFTHDGVQFIVLPEDLVIAFEPPAPPVLPAQNSTEAVGDHE